MQNCQRTVEKRRSDILPFWCVLGVLTHLVAHSAARHVIPCLLSLTQSAGNDVAQTRDRVIQPTGDSASAALFNICLHEPDINLASSILAVFSSSYLHRRFLIMAEALGVASSIVGIVSLGIQVAQGLLTYYGSWKDQDTDISNMCISIESLEMTLEILSNAIQPPAKFDKIIKDNVEKNILLSEVGLRDLKSQLEKANTTVLPKQGVRSTMRRHMRRAFYPFKEQTLRKIQQVVSEARSNLDIALQTLQLFVYFNDLLQMFI
jgi:hypothetical protein